jgi:hypothetical protein
MYQGVFRDETHPAYVSFALLQILLLLAKEADVAARQPSLFNPIQSSSQH